MVMGVRGPMRVRGDMVGLVAFHARGEALWRLGWECRTSRRAVNA